MSSSLVFYVRQPYPRPGLSTDLAAFVLRESEEDLRHIASELENFEGYLFEGRRKSIVEALINEPERRQSYQALLGLVDAFVDGGMGVEDIVAPLKQGDGPDRDEGRRQPFSPEQMSDLMRRLKIIVQSYPGVRRQKKAERLSVATGLSVESIDLICDLRPVFTEDRSKVEGLIPFTTLKIVATGIDRFPISFEAILSARDVQRLFDIAEKAVAKLNALGNFASEAKQTVPLVDLTKPSE